MKIALFDAKDYDKVWFDKLAKEYGHEISYFENRFVTETAVLANGCDACCLFVNDIVNESAINVLHDMGVKAIILRCAGFDNIDLKAAQGKITVMRVPSYSPTAIAEFAACLLLTINRKVHKAYNRTREFNFKISGLTGFNLRGKVGGVVGTGKIGKYMIEILKGFGMKVIAYDPYPDTELDVDYVSFDELLKTSDVVTLHCPLSEDTRYIINRNTISKMKDGVTLINTSRGGLVDTQALNSALRADKFTGVGLDVYEEEDEFFFEDRSNDTIKDKELVQLLAHHNVVVTSHQAYFTDEALESIARTSFENLKAFEAGEFLENEVTLPKK